jgi:hypothetical protein
MAHHVARSLSVFVAIWFVSSGSAVAQHAKRVDVDPTLPAITRLADWRGRLFYSPTSRESFTLIALSPDASPSWRAYGVDLTVREVVFQISLATSQDIQSFITALAQQQVQLALSAPLDNVRFGGWSQLTLPPPPAPSGVDANEWLARRLLRLAIRSLRLDEGFTPTP